jgi:hypothetical protein
MRLKLDYLNPNVQGWNRTLVEATPAIDAIESHRIDFCRWDALLDGRCVVHALQGTSGEPTSCSDVPR